MITKRLIDYRKKDCWVAFTVSPKVLRIQSLLYQNSTCYPSNPSKILSTLAGAKLIREFPPPSLATIIRSMYNGRWRKKNHFRLVWSYDQVMEGSSCHMSSWSWHLGPWHDFLEPYSCPFEGNDGTYALWLGVPAEHGWRGISGQLVGHHEGQRRPNRP